MIKYFLLFILNLIIHVSVAASESSLNGICLNMIVKDESLVICRCLESIKPLINYWVIVDTGSTDDTKAKIKEFMKEIPGELHERTWINFEHNRNEALSLAKNKREYILFIDADEELSFPRNYRIPRLNKDFYHIMVDFDGTHYARIGLIKSQLDFKWTGVLHEAIDTSHAQTSELMQNVKYVVHTDGARSKDPEKFKKDAQTLEAALQKEPNNARYVFYLAQSYRDANEHELALKNYMKRTLMGDWDQEVFWSLLQIGMLQEILEMPGEEITKSYYSASMLCPKRAEPLYRLAKYFRQKGDYFSGYLIARQGLTIPLSDDVLFVESWIYDYGLLLEYAICASGLEKYQEAQLAAYRLLGKNLPAKIRDTVLKTLPMIEAKMGIKKLPQLIPKVFRKLDFGISPNSNF